ncbi:MAG: hypothetical protein KGL39_17620 [Patescibacteria group bacterium]|nr:hypothetical protein [Patescibacteria group bacterium]
MRPLTLTQWTKAPLRTKSWLLVKALGFPTCVYWDITKGGQRDGENLGGSYQTEAKAKGLLAAAREEWPGKYDDYAARRDLTFWGCAEHVNPGRSVVEEMMKRGFSCNLYFLRFGHPAAACSFYNSDRVFNCDAESPEVAICGAAMMALGLIRK